MSSTAAAEKAKLFDDSSEEDEEENEETAEELQAAKVLNVGNSYAQRYNDWRRKEELSKLKQKYGDHLDVPSEIEGSDDNDDDGSEGDEEDYDDEEDSDVSSDAESLPDDPFDEQFLKVYSALKNKAPEIYSKDFAAAAADKDSSAEEEAGSKSPKKGKVAAKKFTLQDYHQKLIKEKKGVTEEDEQMLGAANGDASEEEEAAEKPSGYYEELYNIRREIKDIAKGVDDNSDDDDDDDGDQLFSIKGGPLKTSASPVKKSKDDQKEQLISQIWSGKTSTAKKEKSDTGDEFLKDYILNKRYLDPTLTSSVVKRFKQEPDSHFGGFDKAAEKDDAEEDGSSDGEEEEEDEEEVSTAKEPAIPKYHYEEPDATVIKRYPRAIDSIRYTINEADKKSHRAEVRERKRAEKTAELKRLRRLKREEIEAKIAQLKAVSGAAATFDVKDLDLNVIVDDESEFDSAKYDEKMNLLFGDAYYDTSAADETKPSFEYVPEIDDDLFGDEVAVKPKKPKKKSKKEIKQQRDIMADDDIGLFEDIIGGEVATRFRYRLVEPNDFGLTDEEILRADDSELNKWCSLKKMSQYRSGEEEARDKRAYCQRKNNLELKRKILKSLYEEKKEDGEADEPTKEADNEEGEEEEGFKEAKEDGGGVSKKRSKKRRKKSAKKSVSSTAADNDAQKASASSNKPVEEAADSSPVKKVVTKEQPKTTPTNGKNNNSNKATKKRKRNQSKQNQPNKKARGGGKPPMHGPSSIAHGTDVTVQRLKAYGMSNRDIRKMKR